MLNLNSLLLSTEDPKKLSDFYEKVFGKKPDWVMEKEIDEEFVRIKKTGAKVVAPLYEYESENKGPRIATFEDPDGNYFQIMTPVTM